MLAGTVGFPLWALWTVAERIADWTLPVLGPPWAQLLPLLPATVFLFASVRGMLRWAEEQATDPPSREEPVVRSERSRPGTDCPC